MTPNPIDEIKRIRHQLGADDDFDVHRIFAELRRSQEMSGRTYISRPPRRLAANNPLQASGEAEPLAVENLSSSPAER